MPVTLDMAGGSEPMSDVGGVLYAPDFPALRSSSAIHNSLVPNISQRQSRKSLSLRRCTNFRSLSFLSRNRRE
jgi:hypothetical protein